MMNLQRPRGMSCNLPELHQSKNCLEPGPTPNSKLLVDTIPESATADTNPRAQDTTKEYTHIFPGALSQLFQFQATEAGNENTPLIIGF